MLNSFDENCYYVQTGTGSKWDDFDGPFEKFSDALDQLKRLCDGDYVVPEVLNSAVIVVFKNNLLDLVKDDKGQPIDGKCIYWKKSIIVNGECLFGWPERTDLD